MKTNLELTCPRCGNKKDPKITVAGPQYKASCSRCGCYIQFVSKHLVDKDAIENGPIQVSMFGKKYGEI